MNLAIKSIGLFFAVWVSAGIHSAWGQEGALPDSLSAAIIVKVLGFESSERPNESMRIHVLDNENLALQLAKFEGSEVRGRKLVGVTYGSEIPPEVNVVVASSGGSINSAVSYAESNRAISVTNNPNLLERGAALVVYDDEGLPGILLDKAAAKREGLYWEPDILHIARIVGN